MKHFLIIATLFVSLHTSAISFSGGIRGGLNFQQMKALGWQDNYVTNPYGGVYANLGTQTFSLHVELNYTTNKFTTDSTFKGLYNQYYNTILDSVKTGNFILNQIQIPIMLTYKANNYFWLQGGVIYAAGANAIDENSFVKTKQNIIANDDLSVVGGLWIKLTKRFNLSGRYIQGVKDINVLPTNSNNWRNQSIQVGLGISLF